MSQNGTRRRLLISTLALGLGLSLVIGAASAGPGPAKDGGALTIGAANFDVIDPALVVDQTTAVSVTEAKAAWGAEDASCAMLFRYPVTAPAAQDYSLVPEVATGDPAISRDGKTYTFTIRKGFRFSTGAPVTAQSYVSAINRVLDPAMNSPGAQYLHDVAGIKAVGDHLIVRLTKRVPDFPARMTMPYLCPVPTDLPIAPEGVGAPLPGSGPYYIAEFVRGSRVVLKRNRYYRGTRPHHLDRLVFQVDDQIATNQKVEANVRDVDLNPALQVLEALGAKYGVNESRFFSVRSPNMFYIFMNTERPLFRKNPNLRQAVNFALDRTAMLHAAGPYFGSRTDHYLPPGVPGYANVHPYPVKYADLKRARALARGHTGNGKAVYYTCDANPALYACLAHAQIVQYELRQIGIDVEIKRFPLAVWAEKIATRGEPFDLTDAGFHVPWVDPYQYVNRLLDGRTIQASQNANRSYFNSPHYNRLIDRAADLRGRARYEAYGKLALDIERNAAPMAAYTVRNNRFFVSKRVGCVSVDAHGLNLAGLCLK